MVSWIVQPTVGLSAKVIQKSVSFTKKKQVEHMIFAVHMTGRLYATTAPYFTVNCLLTPKIYTRMLSDN